MQRVICYRAAKRGLDMGILEYRAVCNYKFS